MLKKSKADNIALFKQNYPFKHIAASKIIGQMTSGLVNDILQENIHKLNTISDEIFTELAELQANNLDFVFTESNQLSNSISESDQSEILEHLTEVQTTFTEVSNLVNQIRRSTKSSSKSGASSDKVLNLDQLTTIVKSFEHGSIIKSLNIETTNLAPLDQKQFQLISKLETLTSIYSFIALYQITLSEILNTTIPLGDDLFYWELTSSSTWRSLLYALQTLPIRTSNLVTKVLTELNATASPDIESLDIQIPQYIQTRYPNHQASYKRFVYYRDLLTKSLYNNILTNNLKGFYKALNETRGVQLFGVTKKRPLFKNYLAIIIGAPLSSVHEELESKRHFTEVKQDKNATILGALISNIPDVEKLYKDPSSINQFLTRFNTILDSSVEANSLDYNKSLYNTITLGIPELRRSFKAFEQTTKKPSALTRYWPTILITLLYGPSAVITVLSNKDEIINFIKVNVFETIKGFWKNWILKPANNILSTIRHDDNSEISIMSKSALQSDLDSLKRMVIDYTLESDPKYKSLSSTEVQGVKLELEKLVTTGDLTPLMKEYENDIKEPFKSILKGTLTRGLLIQLQKTKVDGAVAINGIDKLLKSQELVFGIVAASPSLLIIVYLSKAVNSYLQKGYITRSSGEKKLIVSKNLANIERLLNRSEDQQGEEDHINGLLLLEIVSLRKSALYLIPKNRRFEWVRDINDLNNGKLSSHSRLNTINRIYHVYGPYLQ